MREEETLGEIGNSNEGLLGKAVECDQIETLSGEQYAPHPGLQSSVQIEKKLLIIESRLFLRECMQRSIQSALSIPVLTLSSISQLDFPCNSGLIRLAIIFLPDSTGQEGANALGILAELAPAVPTIVLASRHSFETMCSVIGYGAKGYIPMTVGFEIAIAAVRFVLAGGTYFPTECLLSEIPSAALPSHPAAPGAITSRELAVLHAIRQGKPNKIIAYELNMCESTVKVHVRHIMKKLRATNRTAVAIKATELLACSRCTTQGECWSAGRCSARLA